MPSGKDLTLIEKVQTLIDLGVGDRGRLEHIKETIRLGNRLYISDKTYLEKMLQKHSLTDTPEINESPALKSEESKTMSPPPPPSSSSQPESGISEKSTKTSNQTRNSLLAPLGVRILSILSYVIGFLFLIIGIGLLASLPFLMDMIGVNHVENSNSEIYKTLYDILVIFGITLFGMILSIATTGILLGYGLARLKKWSWWLIVLSITLPTVFIPVESFIIDSMSMSMLSGVIGSELLENLEDTEPGSAPSDILISVVILAPIYGIYILVLWYMFKKRDYFGDIKTITSVKLIMVVALVMAPSITTIIMSYLMIRALNKIMDYAAGAGLI